MSGKILPPPQASGSGGSGSAASPLNFVADQELSFVLPFAPASQQSSAQRRAVQLEAVRSTLRPCAFVLTGDVHVDITWLVSERTRYETDGAADVDNILKPLLDGMCGPDGVLVDDCQLVSVTCGWMGGTSDDQEIRVHVRYSPGEWFRKDGLVFVTFERALCLPFLRGESREALRVLVDHVERVLRLRREGEALGIPSEIAALAMPAQRLFHRSKVTRFPVVSADQLRRELDAMHD